jgi:hypothetical protein
MGESTDVLMGSCFQSTLKNEKLEHRHYRQKETLLIRKAEWRDTQWGLETGYPRPLPPQALEWGDIYM